MLATLPIVPLSGSERQVANPSGFEGSGKSISTYLLVEEGLSLLQAQPFEEVISLQYPVVSKGK